MKTYPLCSLAYFVDNCCMFLRMTKRIKDGKEHRYWSIVENHRLGGGRVVQKHVLYLGEINDSQREAWWRSIEVLEHGKKNTAQDLSVS